MFLIFSHFYSLDFLMLKSRFFRCCKNIINSMVFAQFRRGCGFESRRGLLPCLLACRSGVSRGHDAPKRTPGMVDFGARQQELQQEQQQE